MEIHNQSFLEIVLASFTACFTFLFGHNLWLISAGEKDKILIEVSTSDNFPVSDSAVRPERVADFRLVSANGSTPVTVYEVEGKSLVALVKPDTEARFAALELYPHPIVLEPAKFAGYIKSEAAEMLVAPQFIEGETTSAQRESYTKFAKALLDAPGEKQSNDVSFAAGHRLEIIPQNNPAMLQTSGKLPVRVLFEGKPIAGLRVSSGCENLNNGKYIAHAYTDEAGLATVEISGMGLWFVRTHFIRPHRDDAENFDWESFWASLTFRI